MTEERRKGDRRTASNAGVAHAIQSELRKQPSARVFAHPRCTSGPALGAMAAGLESHGFDFTSVKLFAGFHNRHELVREVGRAGAVTEYRRMDGTHFKHRMGSPTPEPTESA